MTIHCFSLNGNCSIQQTVIIIFYLDGKLIKKIIIIRILNSIREITAVWTRNTEINVVVNKNYTGNYWNICLHLQ